MSRPKHVLAVDADWSAATLVRRAAEELGCECVVAQGPEDGVRAAARLRPDLLVVGVEECERAIGTAEAIGTPVIFMPNHAVTNAAERLAKLDVRGVVVKPFSREQLRVALELALTDVANRAAASARRTLARIAEIIESEHLAPGVDAKLLATLTAREREIVRRLIAHERPSTIAERLAISEHTVRNHLKSVFAKLGVHSQTELIERVLARR